MLYNLIKNTGKDFQMMTALEMYADDGQHASPAGSDFAAKYFWETIRMDIISDCGRTLDTW